MEPPLTVASGFIPGYTLLQLRFSKVYWGEISHFQQKGGTINVLLVQKTKVVIYSAGCLPSVVLKVISECNHTNFTLSVGRRHEHINKNQKISGICFMGIHVSVNSQFLPKIPGETSVSYKVACGKPWTANGGKQPQHPWKPRLICLCFYHKKQVASTYSRAKLRPCYKFSYDLLMYYINKTTKKSQHFQLKWGATCKVDLGLRLAKYLFQLNISLTNIAPKAISGTFFYCKKIALRVVDFDK